MKITESQKNRLWQLEMGSLEEVNADPDPAKHFAND